MPPVVAPPNIVAFRKHFRVKLSRLFKENILKLQTTSEQVISQVPDEDTINKIGINIEIGAYNWTIRDAKERRVLRQWKHLSFVTLYIDRCRSLFLNLNESVVFDICTGKYTAIEYSHMFHHQIDMNKWKDVINRVAVSNNAVFNQLTSNSAEVCRKCGMQNVHVYSKQTRSADEPESQFHTCISCGNKWVYSG